jgi:hypothetical protein
VLPERMVQGERVPTPTRLVDVVAIQRGTERPNEVVIVQGTSTAARRTSSTPRSMRPAPTTMDRAPRWCWKPARAVTAEIPLDDRLCRAFGRGTGLLGGKLLADYAAEHGWTIKAVFNNDIVGGSRGSDGWKDDTHVRILSEGPRADGTDALRAAQRRFGGENDSPSRNLSRWLAGLATSDATGWKSARSGAPTAWGVAGTSCRFRTRAIPRCASPWRSRITSTSIRICAPRTG